MVREERRTLLLLATLSALTLASIVTCAPAAQTADGAAPGVRRTDSLTLEGRQDFLRGYPPVNHDGSINVVVEIPAGRQEKWEVRQDGRMHRDMKNGKPRVVQYLGYPGNYGMVPGTLIPRELGGDGDPLDILALGLPHPRGGVIHARVIGVLALLDGGERDDKLIAVVPGEPMGGVTSLSQLDHEYPGVLDIIETWFLNYKGPGVMQSNGRFEADSAAAVVRTATEAFRQRSQ